MDTSDQWNPRAVGASEQRYYVEAGTSTSDLALGASRKALDDAGVQASEIDYIVFATMTPDHYFPGCGASLAAQAGTRAHRRPRHPGSSAPGSSTVFKSATR